MNGTDLARGHHDDGPRFNLLDFLGGLFTESRDELGEHFTHQRQAQYVLDHLAYSADVVELVGTQLADIDPSDPSAWQACSNPEMARRLLAGLIVSACPTERYVTAAEDRDLYSDEDQRAALTMLAAHGDGEHSSGIAPDPWELALAELILRASPDQRRQLGAGYPAWVAFAVEQPARLARLLAAISTA